MLTGYANSNTTEKRILKLGLNERAFKQRTKN